MKYTTEVDVENYLLTTIDPTFTSAEGDTQIDKWIEAMSRFMDRKCNRTLCDTEESARKFDGNGRNSMVIDEVNAISAITIDEVDVLASVLQYPTSEPRTNELRMQNQYFTKGLQNVEVTGIFAMFGVADVDDVPEDIRHACTVLVGGIVNHAMNKTNDVKSEKVGQYSVTYTDPNQSRDFTMAMQTLNAYRRIAV